MELAFTYASSSNWQGDDDKTSTQELMASLNNQDDVNASQIDNLHNNNISKLIGNLRMQQAFKYCLSVPLCCLVPLPLVKFILR